MRLNRGWHIDGTFIFFNLEETSLPKPDLLGSMFSNWRPRNTWKMGISRKQENGGEDLE
jgi:hypothetical protein